MVKNINSVYVLVLYVLVSMVDMHALGTPIFDRFLDVYAYASSYQEYPQPDNVDLLHPDYTSFYEQQIPTWFQKVRRAIGLSKPLWYASGCLDLLQEVTDTRIMYATYARSVQKHTVKTGQKYIVWGSLQGAFHSFVRTLEHLISRGILDEQFRVVNDQYTLVFNGNAINRSAYSLETLSLIARLMQRNPERTIYVAGHEEFQGFWRNGTMRNELQIKLGIAQGLRPFFGDDNIPFDEYIDAFFATLPYGLYLQKDAEMIRISCFTSSELSEDQQVVEYIAAQQEGMLSLDDMTTSTFEKPRTVDMVAIVQESSEAMPAYTSQALQRVGTDLGATGWQILSAPTEVYQTYYNFVYDAYVEITIGDTCRDSTIQTYTQDARTQEGFVAGPLWNMSTGQLQDMYRADTPKTLLVGSTLDLLRATGDLGRSVYRGMTLACNTQNEAGSINGYVCNPVVLNDESFQSRAAKNVMTCKEVYGTNIILCPTGSYALKGYIDRVKQGEFVVIFPLTGAMEFRSPDIKNIVHYSPSYQRESEVLGQYILQEARSNKVALFYQNDAFGMSALEGIKRVFTENKYSSFIEIPYIRNTTDFASQVAQIRKENPDGIVFLSTATAAKELLYQLGIHTIADKHLFGISALGAASFKSFYTDKGLHFVITYDTPNPELSDLPIVQEFRDLAYTYNYPISQYSLLAYIQTSLFLEGMKKVTGPMTGEALLRSFETMKNINFKGLTLNFNPELRVLSNTIWLSTQEQEDWIPFG